VSAIDEVRCEVTWLAPTPQQVDVDFKPHDEHFLSHLKLENLEGAEELTSLDVRGGILVESTSQRVPEYFHPSTHQSVEDSVLSLNDIHLVSSCSCGRIHSVNELAFI
jgi:hypothetical protein